MKTSRPLQCQPSEILSSLQLMKQLLVLTHEINDSLILLQSTIKLPKSYKSMMASRRVSPDTPVQAFGHQADSSSPFLKLFGSDPVDHFGIVRPLQNIRDKIYFYAWSRHRRDDHKLDWVVSQWGFNRNVPERHIPRTPYGTAAFKRLNELPCNLHLANKQVSQDFARYIYSVNKLEIDIDLKAVHSEKNASAFQNIIHLLRNPNFSNFTKAARVRIHFPDQYPAQNLPDINGQALLGIAESLDKFQRLEHLEIRIVPMQGQPLDYELRVAAFPFYPLRMANWSIQILDTTKRPYTWDLLDDKKAAHLDEAWVLSVKAASLATPGKHVENSQEVCSHKRTTKMPSPIVKGSQKRKQRKTKLATEPHFLEAPSGDSNGLTKSCQPCASMTGPSRSYDANDSKDQNDQDEETDDVDEIRESLDVPEFEGKTVVGQTSIIQPDDPVSGPSSPSAHHHNRYHAGNENYVSRSSSNRARPILTPASSSEEGLTPARPVSDVGMVVPENTRSQSPASSSVTLRIVEDMATGHVGDNLHGEQDNFPLLPSSEHVPKAKQERRGAYEAGGYDLMDITEAPDDADQDRISREASDEDQDIDPSDLDNQLVAGHKEQPANRKVNLANCELEVVFKNSGLVFYQDPTSGNINIVPRGARVDRYIRQQERRRAEASARESEQKEKREKRQLRKAKQVLLRRSSVATNSPLSRVLEPRRDSSKQKVSARDRKAVDQETEPSPIDQMNGLVSLLHQLKFTGITESSPLADHCGTPQHSSSEAAVGVDESAFHDRQPSYGLYLEDLKDTTGVEQEIDTTIQEYLGEWAESCPSGDDLSVGRDSMNEEEELVSSPTLTIQKGSMKQQADANNHYPRLEPCQSHEPQNPTAQDAQCEQGHADLELSTDGTDRPSRNDTRSK